MRLLGAVELFGLGVFRLAMDQSGLPALPSEPLAYPRYRRAADLQSIGDLHIGPYCRWSLLAFVGLVEDADLRMISEACLTVESAGQATLPRERSGAVTLKDYRG